MNATETPSGSSLDPLVGRGPECDWTDSQCARCGAIYLDAALPYAQAMHDLNDACNGKLGIMGDEANTKLSSERAAEPQQQTGADARRLLK